MEKYSVNSNKSVFLTFLDHHFIHVQTDPVGYHSNIVHGFTVL